MHTTSLSLYEYERFESISKSYVPVLKSINNDYPIVRGISKSGFTNKASCNDSNPQNFTQQQYLLASGLNPVRAHERTPSFLKSLPDEYKGLILGDNSNKVANMQTMDVPLETSKQHSERRSSHRRESLLENTVRRSSYLINANKSQSFLFNNIKRPSFVENLQLPESDECSDSSDNTLSSDIQDEQLMGEINEEDEKDEHVDKKTQSSMNESTILKDLKRKNSSQNKLIEKLNFHENFDNGL